MRAARGMRRNAKNMLIQVKYIKFANVENLKISGKFSKIKFFKLFNPSNVTFNYARNFS